MKYFKSIVVLLICAGLMGPAHAGGGGKGLSLEQAAAEVRKNTGGRILAAETVRVEGKRMHRIKVMKKGRVRNVLVDPGK